jgi:hypothetical protein
VTIRYAKGVEVAQRLTDEEWAELIGTPAAEPEPDVAEEQAAEASIAETSTEEAETEEAAADEQAEEPAEGEAESSDEGKAQ